MLKAFAFSCLMVVPVYFETAAAQQRQQDPYGAAGNWWSGQGGPPPGNNTGNSVTITNKNATNGGIINEGGSVNINSGNSGADRNTGGQPPAGRSGRRNTKPGNADEN